MAKKAQKKKVQKKSVGKNKFESSDDDKPMKLRKRTQKYDYQESSEESDSGDDSPINKKTKNQISKKLTKLSEFKKGEYNHKIKDIPLICKQLEGNNKESYECCVRCANKELIRSVIIKDLKMFQRILSSGQISHPFQRWAPDNNFTILHEILKLKEKKFAEALIKQLQNKIIYAKENRFGLRHVETGYNSRSAYGADVRIVEVSRKGRQGNNAFIDDVFREEIWGEKLISELMSIKSDNQCWLLLMKSQLIPKHVVNTFYEKLIKAVESGNYKLAGLLIQQIYKYPCYGYNVVHLNVLTKSQPKDLGEFKKASATKKNSREILTPIHCAAINPNPRILEAVLEIGQEYSLLDGRMRRPIHYAAANESSGCVEFLIKKGVDVREGDNTKTTPLMLACLYGRLHNLELLISSGVDTKNRMGSAALHFATKGGHLDCVKFLIEQEEANINQPGEMKMTALHIAAAFNHFQIVQYLISQGAKVTSKDKFGRTPLILAARNGSLVSLAYLLQKGSEYNLGDSSKNTPLHYACAYGFIECVELLIKAGADQNLCNSWNLTPLSIGLAKNHKKIVDYLLHLHSTDINCKDDQGRTLIANEILRKEIKLDYIESLISKNADINICDLQGQSPLHLAAERTDGEEAVKLLLKYGVNVNIQDNEGQSAIIQAVKAGNFTIAKLILQSSQFNKNQLDRKGQTLLQQIIENNVFLNAAEGIDLIEYVISISSHSDIKNINIEHLQANQQLFIRFTTLIKHYFHIQLKEKITSYLKEKHESGKFDSLDIEVEKLDINDEDIDDSKQLMNQSGEQDDEEDQGEEQVSQDQQEECDQDDEENEGDQDDEENEEQDGEEEEQIPINKKSASKTKVGKRKAKKEQMDIEHDDDENDDQEELSEQENNHDQNQQEHNERMKNLEINNQLLSENKEKAKENYEIEIKDQENDKNYKYYQILGKRYRLQEPFAKTQVVYSEFSLKKYVKTYKVELFDKERGEIKTENLKVTLNEVQNLAEQVTNYCLEIERKVLKIFQTSLPLTNDKLENNNGRYLIHYVYGCYPKLSFINLFNNQIVKDNDLNSQYHYLQFLKSSPLYDITDMLTKIPDNYLDENKDGDTFYHLAAIKQIFYKNVNHINNKNEVPLFEAIRYQQVTNNLLEQVDSNFTDRDFRNGLHFCMMYNDQITLQKLILKGANPEQKDKYGRTPIFYAFIKNNNLTDMEKQDPFELVIYLAKNCNQIDIYGRTALHYAAQSGSSMSIRQLLSRQANGQYQDKWGNTPLSLAFLGMHLDTTITLIDYKYNIHEELNVVDYNDVINEITFNNEEAKEKENEEENDDNSNDDDENDEKSNDNQSEKSIKTVQTCNTAFMNQMSWKLRNRNDQNSDDDQENNKKEDQKKYTPPISTGKYSFFRMSLLNEWPQIEYLLLANGFPLHQAIQDCLIEKKYKRASILLQKANVEDLQQTVPNLWYIFAKYGKDSISQDIFKQIVQSLQCLSFKVIDTDLMSPFHYACQSGFITLVKYLMNKVENIDQADKLNNTPFSYYIQSLKSIDIDFLNEWISLGCQINLSFSHNGQRTTLLNFLTKYKEFYQKKDKHYNQTLLDILLKNKCNVNDKDSNGQTLLFIAIQQNNLNLIKAIWNQVDKKQQFDNQGRTPLHYVVSPTEFGTYDNIELLKFLYPHFNQKQVDKYGKTILDYASQFDNTEIKSFILKEFGIKNNNLPRRAATSVISNTTWPNKIIDYLNDATQYLNQQNNKSQFIAEVDFKAKENFPNTTLFENYSCLMTKVDVNAGYYAMNVFYKMQILKENNRNFYILFTRWGAAYSYGQFQHTPFQELDLCVKEFKKIFKSKSGNDWDEPFISQPKKYHLVTLKPHRNIQQYLQPFSSTIETKLQPSLIELLKNITNVKLFLQNLPDLNIEEYSLYNLAKEDLEQGESILFQLEQVLKQFILAKEARELDLEELEKLGEQIATLSNKYYEYIPHKEGTNKLQVSSIVSQDQLDDHFRRVNTLTNFEVSTKILLGALFKQTQINPLDYCLNSLNIRILSLEQSNIEYQMISEYAQQKIKNIYCVERKGEAQRMKQLSNKYLLWHGTKSTNLLGILSLGLKIAPSWADNTGTNFGKGIYFADSLKKSLGYTDEKQYLLLCEVALGKYTEIDGNKKEFDQNQKYQSVKALGKFESKQSKCITIGNGCKVPIGELLEIRPKAMYEWNEYIVYSEDQVRIRYIVQIQDELQEE